MFSAQGGCGSGCPLAGRAHAGNSLDGNFGVCVFAAAGRFLLFAALGNKRRRVPDAGCAFASIVGQGFVTKTLRLKLELRSGKNIGCVTVRMTHASNLFTWRASFVYTHDACLHGFVLIFSRATASGLMSVPMHFDLKHCAGVYTPAEITHGKSPTHYSHKLHQCQSTHYRDQ